MWKIAEKLLGSGSRWRELYEANKGNLKSGSPNVIYPGETLNMPGGKSSTSSRSSSSPGSQSQSSGQRPSQPFDQFMAETGRQSTLDSLRRSGKYDEFKSAYQRGEWPPPAAPKSAEELIKEQQEITKNLISEQLDFLKDFLSKNPFAFDEAMAKEASQAKFKDYYDEVLSDFVEPIREKIGRSLDDSERILTELVRRRDLGETQKLREIEQGLEKARGGFAGRGLLGSGGARRSEAVQKIEGREDIEDFMARSEEEETSLTLTGERERSDYERDIGRRERDIFGEGREYETEVTKDVQSRKQRAFAKVQARGQEAYESRYGVSTVGQSGQSASDYLSKYLDLT